MKTSTRIILKGSILLLAAVGAILWANSLMASLTSYRSPLADQPPAAGQPLGKANTRRIIFVLIDGLRVDTAMQAEVMPYLNELRAAGAWAKMYSRAPSYSASGYTVLFTGAWADINDGPIINLPYEEIRAWTQDNLFSAVARAGQKTAVSGYYWFERLIPQADVHTSFYTPGEDQSADQQVVDIALPWLADSNLNFILIHLDQVDYAGHHEGGARDPRWDSAAGRTDALLKKIVAQLDLTQDTLVIASDHGHLEQGGHGGQDADVLVEPFLLIGAGIKPGEYPDIAMVDVAPTLAALLGASLPASSQGQVRTQMLDLESDKSGLITVAQVDQQKQLLGFYTKAIGQELPSDGEGNPPVSDQAASDLVAFETVRQSRLSNERLPRLLLGLACLLIPSFLFLRKFNRDKGWMLLAGLIYLLLFNVAYTWLAGRSYSLSTVRSAGDVILTTGLLALAAFLACGIIFAWQRQVRRRSRSMAADVVLSLALVVGFLASIPVTINYVLNGGLVTWTLPDFLSSFLGFISLIQILFISLGGLILAGAASLSVHHSSGGV